MIPRMHLFSILLISALLTLGSLGFAQSDTQTLLKNSFTEGGLLKDELLPQLEYATQQFSELPGPVKSIFGNQVIEVELKLDDGSIETLGVVTKGEAIAQVTKGVPVKETLKVRVDEETLNTIANADDIQAAFIEAVSQKKLTYEGVTAEAQLTVFITDIVVWLLIIINAFKHALGMS
jgi:hypothetical protein